ncbi:MAG: class I SAM-dependent methyltransferase [Bacteroidota bacterium]
MSKLQKILKVSGLLLRKPYLLNKILDDNDVWLESVQNEYGLDGFSEIKFHHLSAGKDVQVKPFAFMEGGSLPTDLALLKVLASGFDACRYFEIGTWRGESVANVAEVAAQCTTLNLSIEELEAFGRPPEYTGQYAMYSKGLPNVLHLEGNSMAFDFSGLDTKYDLIFIDGDHHYESIKSDTENVFRHLMHEKSIVVWHDYAWQPGNVRHETMAAIMAGVPPQLRNKLYAVRNTLCAIYYPGELKTFNASSIATRDEAFEVVVKVKMND